MDFSGPRASDFANVRALNHAYLVRLRSPRQGRPLRRSLPAAIAALLEALTDLELERLAGTPFLLFSLCERDDTCWRSLDDADPTRDLLSTVDPGDELRGNAVAFLWQLASHSPYVARLVSGAGPGWCERLAAHTLLDVQRAAAGIDDLLLPRFAKHEGFWNKLLGPGLSADSRVRQAAHVTCLQWLLTTQATVGVGRLRAAACNNPVPALSVAEKPRPR